MSRARIVEEEDEEEALGSEERAQRDTETFKLAFY